MADTNNRQKTYKQLESEIENLRRKLEQADQTLAAIRSGQVDALVIASPEGDQVYTLRGTDHPYRALVEDMNEGALTLSADGILLYCNRRFAEMLQLPLVQVLGEPFARFVAPEDRAKASHVLGQGLQGSSKGEITLRAADESRLVADLSLHRMVIEGAPSLSGVVMDITERARLHEQVQRHASELEQRVAERTAELEAINQRLKNEIVERTRTQEALKASEERFRLALTDSRITVFNQDRDLRYTWVYNLPSGFDPEDILCRTDAELWPPEQAALLEQIKQPALAKGLSGRGEVTLHAGRETHVFDISVDPQRDAAGNIIGITSVAVDVSDRKESEQALQHANQNLMSWASELEQRNREISQLNEMGDLLQSCLTPEEAYVVIAQAARNLLPGDSGALYVLNNSKNLIEAAATWGEFGPDDLEQVFSSESCWALRRGRIHLVADSQTSLLCEHVRRNPASHAPYSSMCIPMMAQGETLGIFYLQTAARPDGQPALSESKQRLAVSIAEHVALALSSLRLRETLQRQAIRDSLTGLFNRRYMEESLEREMRRATRKHSTVGIVMLDLDHFKQYNDAFGHQVGDVILREFGNFLKGQVRGGDVACRYGGEEFTLILPETPLEETCERAEQIRQELKFLQVQHSGQTFGNLSVSLGVAIFPEHAETAEQILQAADAALYQAKTEGRDRVIVAARQEQ
ncbi:MAG: diguanylate cyclase [Chloroflexi bacterium]|nr:diguanylate cyclase [Chloroflexota bacterium]